MFFLFARAENSGRVYWSSYQPGVGTGYDQSFWEPIDSLGNIENIVGAAVYEISDIDRYIYLFVKKVSVDEVKLMYIKYNLENPDHGFEEAGSHELYLPEGTIDFKGAINQENDSSIPPELIIQTRSIPVDEDENDSELADKPKLVHYERTYIKRMSRAGNSWDPRTDSLFPFLLQKKGKSLNLLSMVSLGIKKGVSYALPQYFLVLASQAGSNEVA